MNTRRASFVLTATDHGPMIVNRFDQLIDYSTGKAPALVGISLMEKSQYEYDEILSALALLDLRRASRGDGLKAIDCGANVGVHTLEMAKHMTGWGEVLAFEPQERVYYALCGNIALNNIFNAQAVFAAVGKESGTVEVPLMDYGQNGNWSGMTLVKDLPNNDPANYTGQRCEASKEFAPVNMVTIDSMELDRLDFMKIDVEGMELDVIEGARGAIEKYRPIILAEWIRCGKKALTAKIESFGYRIVTCDNMNLVGVHPDVELMAAAE